MKRIVGAVIEDVNELSGERIPLLEKEGWMRGPKMSRSHLSPRRRARSASAIARSINSGQTGEIIRPERFRRTDAIRKDAPNVGGCREKKQDNRSTFES